MIRYILLWPRKFVRVANVLLGILLLLVLVTLSIRWLGPGEIDRIVARVLTESNIPGASIAIVEHGQVRYLKAYGWADVERKRPVKIDSLFRIASIAKSFTGAAILKLVAERLWFSGPSVRRSTWLHVSGGGLLQRQHIPITNVGADPQ